MDRTGHPASSFYRDSMPAFVVTIAQQAARSEPFFVVAQNGEGLLVSHDASETGSITAYADALAGVGREDLFYGYEAEDRATPSTVTLHWLDRLDRAEARGIEILAIDYCTDNDAVAASYEQSAAHAFVALAHLDENSTRFQPPIRSDG